MNLKQIAFNTYIYIIFLPFFDEKSGSSVKLKLENNCAQSSY